MHLTRRSVLKGSAAASALAMLKVLPASAAASGRLVVVLGDFPNSMDVHKAGSNRPSYSMAMALYDRLVSFDVQTLDDGSLSFDPNTIVPELAESWEVADDGRSITFHLRRDATFWDGTAVTADDVKWSFDRAVSVGGFPPAQMRAGLMENPEQFVVVDEHTFRVDFPEPSKLSLPDIAVPVPFIINSKVAKEHATEDDPWAVEWLSANPAGGGAYMLEGHEPGQQIVLRRNDDWKSGSLPGIEQVVMRQVPSAATRRALIERGDVDVNFDLPPRDAREQLEAGGDVRIVGTPIANTLHGLGLNLNFPPFDDVRVRKAVAYAVPYEEIFDVAAYGRGSRLFGDKAWQPGDEPPDLSWPRAFPYATDIERAKALLEEAGHGGGFDTVLGLNLSLAEWMEPTCLLIQESLARIGIQATIEKVPGATWRTVALIEKKMPMHMTNFGGWLDYPEYYAFFQYRADSIFNSMAYKNPEIEQLIADTLHMAVDHPDRAPNVKRIIQIVADDVPMVPLYQPMLDVALRPSVDGYVFQYHRTFDPRYVKKA